MILKNTLLLSCATIALSVASPALAKDMSMQEMQKQLELLSSQVQTLSKTVAEQNNIIHGQQAALEKQGQTVNDQSVAIDTLANIAPAAGEGLGDVKITMKPSPKIESLDGTYSFQPFGRMHMDVTSFDDDQADHANNGNFRRARLGFKGKLGEDFEYKSEFDFAEEGVNFKEVTLAYTGLESADIKIGHQKPAVGMEQNTSSNYLMFMERSAPTNAFTRDEEIGLNVLGGGSNWSLGAGVFNEDAGNDDTGEDEDITFDTRGSINLLGLLNEETENVLHLGAGYSHREPTGNVRFRAKPAGDGNNIIDTGNIASVDSVGVYTAELAAVVGPVSLQSEYFKADLSRSGGTQDADFDGYYGQIGWFVTGETRPYKGKTGNFSRVKPISPFSLKEGGWGAWEVLARYENADLNDASAGITGGEAKNTAVGVNWHLTDYIRLMANVTSIDTDSNAVVANDDPTVYNFRAQWDF